MSKEAGGEEGEGEDFHMSFLIFHLSSQLMGPHRQILDGN
jgi:hypothetical protein